MMKKQDKKEILDNTILKVNEILEKNKDKSGVADIYLDIQELMKKRNLKNK